MDFPPPHGAVKLRTTECAVRTRRFLLALFVVGCSGPAVDVTPHPGFTGTSSDAGGHDDDASAPAGDASPDADASGDVASVDASMGDTSTPMGPLVAYISGYDPTIGVYAVNPTSGALSQTSTTTSFGSSPSFLAMSPSAKNLYALDENTNGQVGAYAVDATTGALTFLSSVSSQGDGPAFLSVDGTGKFVLVANYGDGTVAVLPVQTNGSVGAAVDMHTVGANAHMIIADPSNRYVFVPCLGANYVAQFEFDDTTGMLTPNSVATVAVPSGSGPRHLAFHPTLPYAYLLSETASTVTPFSFDATTGRLAAIDSPQSTIPHGFSGTNTGAEVHVHPSGRFVFASNRGDDSVVAFDVDPTTGKITYASRTPTGGMTPRDFGLDPTGALLYAANQNSNTVFPFLVDATHGTIAANGGSTAATMPSFVGLFRLPAP
jgi:6-phosphogluconolactonase